jgi:hypothetical protein
MWDLWWRNWHWGRISPNTSGFPANSHSISFSLLIIIRSSYNEPTSGRSGLSLIPPHSTNINNHTVWAMLWINLFTVFDRRRHFAELFMTNVYNVLIASLHLEKILASEFRSWTSDFIMSSFSCSNCTCVQCGSTANVIYKTLYKCENCL